MKRSRFYLTFPFYLLVSIFFLSCSSQDMEYIVKPMSVEINGDLGKYLEVVNDSYKIKKDNQSQNDWEISVKLKLIKKLNNDVELLDSKESNISLELNLTDSDGKPITEIRKFYIVSGSWDTRISDEITKIKNLLKSNEGSEEWIVLRSEVSDDYKDELPEETSAFSLRGELDLKVDENNEEDLTNTLPDMSGKWSGPYANNTRTVHIVITKSQEGRLEGYSFLELPSGENVLQTNFNGNIELINNGSILRMVLTEYGNEKSGVFEIDFNPSDPNEGKGTWKSNVKKITRDLTIFRNESNSYQETDAGEYEDDSEVDRLENKGYSNQNTNKEDWDKALDSFEDYIDDYLKLLKKAKGGDMSAMTEYPTIMKKADDLSRKLNNAKGELSSSQIARLMKLQQKIITEANKL